MESLQVIATCHHHLSIAIQLGLTGTDPMLAGLMSGVDVFRLEIIPRGETKWANFRGAVQRGGVRDSIEILPYRVIGGGTIFTPL